MDNDPMSTGKTLLWTVHLYDGRMDHLWDMFSKRPFERWSNPPLERRTVVDQHFGLSKITVVDRNFGPFKITVVDRSFEPAKITNLGFILDSPKLRLWIVILDHPKLHLFTVLIYRKKLWLLTIILDHPKLWWWDFFYSKALCRQLQVVHHHHSILHHGHHSTQSRLALAITKGLASLRWHNPTSPRICIARWPLRSPAAIRSLDRRSLCWQLRVVQHHHSILHHGHHPQQS